MRLYCVYVRVVLALPAGGGAFFYRARPFLAREKFFAFNRVTRVRVHTVYLFYSECLQFLSLLYCGHLKFSSCVLKNLESRLLFYQRAVINPSSMGAIFEYIQKFS